MREVKRKIKGGLAALVIAGAGVLGFAGCFGNCEKNILSPNPVSVANYEGRKGEILEAGRKYLDVFLNDYVNDMTEFSDEIKDNIKFYNSQGKDGKREVVNGYFKLYDLCWSFAVSNADKEVSEQEYSELGEKLAGIHKEMAKKTLLKLDKECVKGGYSKWARDKVERNKKIVKKNLNTKFSDFKKMYGETFSEEKAVQEFLNQNDAEKKLYEGFKMSLEPVLRLFGIGIIDTTQRKSWELNRREFERIYGKKWKKK